ncbi:hypothetical protein Lesp02_70430 [Lentzea sp. NBRC 105346]|uniref:hypothetical protein n=1 Tax=Lentzea sp. NBRC 105346 TaxID=3032205 RepID=UPI0024A3D8BB|nr:hypothetical protein [Lentzea sp. NBRC 105346]GLZ34856.1 hypothetical protein Lesp02_70430 [Lentzea sp. NBRC 105346]
MTKPKHNPLRHDLLAVGAMLALPVIEWWDDRTRTERAAAALRVVIVAVCVAAVVFLSGCGPAKQPIEGVDKGSVPFSSNQAVAA